jgi:hypothetical protein
MEPHLLKYVCVCLLLMLWWWWVVVFFRGVSEDEGGLFNKCVGRVAVSEI